MSKIAVFPLADQHEALFRRVQEEHDRLGNLELPIVLDLSVAMGLVAMIQLSLRHPANAGPSPIANLVRKTVDGIIEQVRSAGYQAHAELLKLGDNPAHDIPC